MITPGKIFVLIQVFVLLGVAYSTAREDMTAYWAMSAGTIALGIVLGFFCKIVIGVLASV